jgi:signal transduction histidine kinase/ligand-binding sensor domain-containing protein
MGRDHLHRYNNAGSAIGARAGAAEATAQCLSAALFLLAVLPVCAQQLSLRRYDVPEGLANSHVSAIHQDSKGYIWFGTWEGLSRFDGYSFTNYGVRDGLGHMVVNDITEDRRGRLWIATNGGGVSRLIDDPQEAAIFRQNEPATGVRRRFISFRVGDSPDSNRVNALLFDPADNLWLATDDGVYRAATASSNDLHFKTIAPYHPTSAPGAAFADRRGRLWFGMNDELIQVSQNQVIRYGREDEFGRQVIISVVEDRRGRLLAATPREVFEFVEPVDGESRGSWRRLSLVFQPGQLIWAMLSDSAGALWIGTANGLIKYQDGKPTLYTIAQGLSDDHIRSLAEDRDGNVWIGSWESGVRKLSGAMIVNFTRTEGLPNLDVLRVTEDRRGRIYASIANGGIVEIVEGGATLVPGSRLSAFDYSAPFQDSRGDWWVLIPKSVSRFEGPGLRLRRGGKLTIDNGILPGKLNIDPIVTEDPFGKLWVMYAGEDLYRLDLLMKDGRKGRAVFEHIPLNATLPAPVVRMMSDRAGTLWLGGHGMLARFMKGKLSVLRPAEGLPETNPRAFFQDSRGWLWIGLRYKGVSMTKNPNAETPQFVNYSTEHGLASDAVWSITEDDSGRIYLGGGKGLDQLNPMTGRIRHFSVKDGLAGAKVNHCIKDRNGNIWIATPLGLSKLNPRAERIVYPPPPVYLSRVQVAGEDLPLAVTGEQSIPEIELPSSRNNLLIVYVALSFRGEQRLLYQYKLEGVDRYWSQPAEARSVNYARLAPGSYQFMVCAIIQDGPEGMMRSEPAVFHCRILPPLWQRWWFVALAALGVGLTALAFYRSRVKRMIELERVRTRIATDLHDDIGSSLSQIAILSEVSRRRIVGEQNGVGESLAQIANTSRDLVDSMSDIVWAINPHRDRLSDLAQRMREFAGDVFSAREIEFSFRAPAGEMEVRLDADVRRQLYLIFKEAVNNAARHSRCTQAEIELEVAQDRLLLLVRDNGRGFDTSSDAAASRNGNGLVSMRERARTLGGEIEIISQANLGAAVKLDLPLGPRAGSRWRKYLPV